MISHDVSATAWAGNQDGRPAAIIKHTGAALQFMMTEIHMTSQLGTAEILSRATTSFSKNISDYTTAEDMVQHFQTFKGLLEQTTASSVQSPAQMLLTRMAEGVPADHISG